MIERLKRRRVYSGFKVIFGQQIDLKWAYCFLKIEVLNIKSLAKHLNDKKAKAVFNGFIKIVIEPNCKPNKLWDD